MRGLLNEYLPETSFDPKKVRGFFNHDPYVYPLLNGDFPDNPKNIQRKLYELFDTTSTHLPGFKALNVNGTIFHNAGAHAVQEIAFTLALANEYLVMLTDQELKIDLVAPLMQITLSAGSNYFLEIAKFRAIRLLWAKIIEQYKPKKKESLKLMLHAVSSEWNKSIYDPYTNVLRNTTEAMSAIIGGVDLLTILPFDLHYKKPNEFSKRLAKNIQILLKEESYLDKVIDPSSGSYYIEVLTDKIASESWEMFKKIEAEGGFLENIKEGKIQSAIEEVYQQTIKMVMSRRESVLGLNTFPNVEEKIAEELEIQPYVEEEMTNAPFRTLPQNRKAIIFEELRLRTENFVRKGGKNPIFFMLPIGNPGMASARQIFSRNFFGVAGFQIVENSRFMDISLAVKDAKKALADVIVICSSDEEYKDVAAKIAVEAKEKMKNIQIVVAGNPVEIIDELREAGISDFIHLKSDLMTTLEKYQKHFGIL
jgi:methylmalonyl-CoA mutase